MKKYLAFISCLALMLSICTFATSISVSATESGEAQYNKALSMMKMLGVIEDGVTYSPDDPVCREDVAVYVANLLNIKESSVDNRYFTDVSATGYGTWAINELTAMGIFSVDSERKFNPDATADMNEVYKVVANILGYEKYAQAHGGYPAGYLKALRIADVPAVASGAASFLDVMCVLYDAVQAPMYEPEAFTAESTVMKVTDRTILSLYHDIYYDYGTVEAIGGMCISNGNSVEENQIMINGITYVLDANIYEPLCLSQFVEFFYVNKKNAEKTVKLVFEDGDKEDIEINISDIEILNEKEVQYLVNDKKKNIDILGSRWIYNGRPLETKLAETLNNLNKGKIIMRVSDNDKKYDTILVWNYSNFVVSHIDKSRKTVYNKLEEAGRIEFANNETDGIWIYDEKNNKLAFDDVSEGSVLSVATSIDKKLISVIVSMTEFNGVLSSKIESPLTLIVNGNRYEIEPSYEKEFRDLAFATGGTYKYKVDPFGYIAFVYSGESDSAMKYGYIVDSALDGVELFGSGVLKIKMLTLRDKVEEFKIAEKARIDGKLFKAADEMIKAFKNIDANGNIAPQIVRYALNDDGEIRAIDTMYLNPDYETEFNSITSIGPDKTKVRWYMEGRLGLQTYIDDAHTVVFCRPLTPLSSAVDEEEYSSGKPSQHFKTNYYRYSRIYTSNVQNGYAEAILYDYEYNQLDKNQGYYIDVILVDSITEVLDKDGQVVKCINGMTSGKNVSYKIPDNVTIGDVSKGDLIQLRFGIRGQVIPATYPKHSDYTDPGTDIIVLYDYDKYNSGNNGGHPYDWAGNSEDRVIDGEVVAGTATTLYEDKSNSSTEFYRAERQLSFGYVLEKSESQDQIWWSYKKNTGLKNETFKVSRTSVMVYDPSLPEKHQIYSGTIDDIDDAKNVGIDNCSKVILHTSIGEAKSLFVFK